MDINLVAETGRTLGTRPSRRLRREGKVPGVVYGLGHEPRTIAVEWLDLRKALITDAGLNALITLNVEGTDQLTIVKELQRHPVRRDVIHVDFIAIDADAEITVEVPIVLVGEAELVLQEGGMVDQTLYALTVTAKPDAIPNEVEVDISALTIGGSITLAEMTLPPGVTTEVELEEAIATGQITRAAEAEADSEEGEGGEGGDDAASSDGEG